MDSPVVVDEAHVVSHWGAGFRKKYGVLGILRALLPKKTPMVAMSATLPPRVREDVLKKLQYNQSDFVNINLGNDRPNVSLVVRAIQNPMNTYTDLNFIIPAGTTTSESIKKTFVYADSVSSVTEITEHLYTISPETFREQGVIRPYSAAYSAQYRTNVMELFKAGVVRVLVCTEAAGMGCNIPDVDMVVQWKLTSSVSSFVQRAGRAARGSGRTGIAVLLVEKTTYEADLFKIAEARIDEQGKLKKKLTVRQSSAYSKSKDRQYAVNRGVLRGAFGGATDALPIISSHDSGDDVPLDSGSIDEGLYTLVQTRLCRRQILTKIYKNQIANPTVPCCDLCHPALLELTRPAAPEPAARKASVKAGICNENLMDVIAEWRTKIWKRDFSKAQFGPSGILSNSAIERLSSVGPIKDLDMLEQVLGGNWPWFERYGEELLTEHCKLPVPQMQPKARQSRIQKRIAEPDESGEGSGERQKRQRAELALPPALNPPALLTPVIAGPPTPSMRRSHHSTPLVPLPSTPMQPAPVYAGYTQYPAAPNSSSPLSSNPYAGYFAQYSRPAFPAYPASTSYSYLPSTPAQSSPLVPYPSYPYPYPYHPQNQNHGS
ncbi:P-loop containing nucleoside triphosphate hydrolase protein [Pholiota molesta]|nr:P-loop containing nucleoside triphosphate hydrolase protein [Pholiota molesta]